jgi:probable rRNA maturation factor
MEAVFTIDISLTCFGWSRVCPAAERLAVEAGRQALAGGMAALGMAPAAPVELGVILADAAEQQRLNHEFRGQDTPTNVLAFPAWELGIMPPPGLPILLGDVVLAFETVLQEAAEQDKPIGDHLSHLVVHGVLHLLGFDHLAAADADRMEALEVSLLAELGIAHPYRDPAWPMEAGSGCDE